MKFIFFGAGYCSKFLIPLLPKKAEIICTHNKEIKKDVNDKKHNIKRIIYASSGSVYGVNDKLEITEETELNPISEYNKTKMVSERVLLSYQDDMMVQIIRPATVCGISLRMRLDVAVNRLPMQALEKGKITVFGGN